MSSPTPSELRGLFGPIDAERPSGESLEYDPMFVAMERAASGREEQQYGETVIEEEPPRWVAVRELATALSRRTHDLRVGVYLAESVIEFEGLSGFTQCLEMLGTWLRNEWETVHPTLDADDDRDPTLRVNTLTRLTDSRRILRRLRALELTEVRGLGTVTIGALADLSDMTTADTEEAKATEAAVSGGPVEPLLAAATSLRRALRSVNALDHAIAERVGVARSVEFAPLTRLLKTAIGPLGDRLQRRGARVENSSTETRPQDSPTVEARRPLAFSGSTGDGLDSLEKCDMEVPPRTSSKSPREWAIDSRHDVSAALDRLCEYFAEHEPSSPIPLLLGRAKRLVPMGFLEILQELGPDFLSQAQRLQGSATANR